MKILHVNIQDNYGAGTAAYRIHKALLASGVTSNLLVKHKTRHDETVIDLSWNKLQKLKSELLLKIERLPLKKYNIQNHILFSPSTLSNNFIARINSFNADVVHFHWINRGFLTLKKIAKIKSPVVFSMHDMWIFTGGCHYTEGCMKFKTGCGSCPMLYSNDKVDLSAKLFKGKESFFYDNKNVYVIGLSNWMADSAKSSQATDSDRVFNLPNCINIEQFKPKDKDVLRKENGLPMDKKLILFGAMDGTSDKRKGFKQLLGALTKLNSKNYDLVIFGTDSVAEIEHLPFKSHFMGHISDPEKMIEIYSMADITIVPSLEENLSNVIMESLACATPVAAFNIGGNADMIKHMENGFLAQPFDTGVLSQGIDNILSSDEQLKNLSKNARAFVKDTYSYPVVAKRYIEFYKKILRNNV